MLAALLALFVSQTCSGCVWQSSGTGPCVIVSDEIATENACQKAAQVVSSVTSLSTSYHFESDDCFIKISTFCATIETDFGVGASEIQCSAADSEVVAKMVQTVTFVSSASSGSTPPASSTPNNQNAPDKGSAGNGVNRVAPCASCLPPVTPNYILNPPVLWGRRLLRDAN